MNASGRMTFHGNDPAGAAAATVSTATPTNCQARTRLYRNGVLIAEGFPVADISEHLLDDSAVVWLDLHDPDRADLAVLSEEFGLHPLAVEDAVQEHERTKLDRYESHVFLTAYAVHLNESTGELALSEISAFVTGQALITVRKDDGMDIGAVVSCWDYSPDLAKEGVEYLLYGLLDHIVDGYFNAVQSLDDQIEGTEDHLFTANAKDQ